METLVEVQYAGIKRETENAVLFEVLLEGSTIDDEVEIWIPRSLIKEENPNRNKVSVPTWFAKKEGLV